LQQHSRLFLVKLRWKESHFFCSPLEYINLKC